MEMGSSGALRRFGQAHHEARAAGRVLLDVDAAPLRLDREPAERQAEPARGAGLIVRELDVAIEHAKALVGRDAGPAIRDREPRAERVAARRDLDVALVRGVPARVI